jgi:alpha-glucosidase
MAAANGLYLTIHEAALIDYPAMALKMGTNTTLECDLYPWSNGTKVKASTPLQTPWRTIQIAENPGDLITSYLILNLNEPNKLEDTSWIKPGKYVGIWWGMHIGTYTWGSGPNHGATTENAMRYIDFASEYGFDGVLIEGWNLGWDGNWTANGDEFSFTQPYPDFDIQAVTEYAASKGVKLIGHHETGAAIQNYEGQMDAAFQLYQSLGVDTVKTGYVGWGQGIKHYDDRGYIQGVEWHHGQYMVAHYRKVIETAAKYHIMLDVHEPVKDTGERRTYPNMMTREGARGQEYDAWSEDGGNPPDHTTILPFTRMMAGPFDLTPGTFDLMIEAKPDNRVNTTLAKQLALYVVIYSPMHMASDLPENYIDQPAFQFIQDVPTDWRDTQVLDAAIGDAVTIVRQDRNSDDWYLGSITDENGRSLDVTLDFLDPDRKYVAEIYADGPDADWLDNLLSIKISQVLVDNGTSLTLDLAPGGGAAVRFRPATPAEIETILVYTP